MYFIYLQAINYCFCGNKLKKSLKMKESDCWSLCAGDKRQACGGTWRIAVYKNPKITPGEYF